MNSALMLRYLDLYFESIAEAKAGKERLRLIRLAREAQLMTSKTLTQSEQNDAAILRVLLAQPDKQMSCKKLAREASLKGWSVHDAIKRGVIGDFDERGVHFAKADAT